jgi:hypothetical protein
MFPTLHLVQSVCSLTIWFDQDSAWESNPMLHSVRFDDVILSIWGYMVK